MTSKHSHAACTHCYSRFLNIRTSLYACQCGLSLRLWRGTCKLNCTLCILSDLLYAGSYWLKSQHAWMCFHIDFEREERNRRWEERKRRKWQERESNLRRQRLASLHARTDVSRSDHSAGSKESPLWWALKATFQTDTVDGGMEEGERRERSEKERAATTHKQETQALEWSFTQGVRNQDRLGSFSMHSLWAKW